MRSAKIRDQGSRSLAWLAAVNEVQLPVNSMIPIIVRRKNVPQGAVSSPTIPCPEKHPYCELGLNFEGDLLEFIGLEKVPRRAGSLMMIGPGIPHNAIHLAFPHRTIVVHFLPGLLLELGPEGDGARMLSRLTAAQKISDRVFQTPPELGEEMMELFENMANEFEERRICWEFRLRALLAEIITKILRWEESAGREVQVDANEPNWEQMAKTLRFIHKNFARRLYVDEIAQAAGLTLERLQAMFHSIHGISCMQYLQDHRISRSKGLLCVPGMRVTEAALSVGFGTANHFNTAFKKKTGISPTEYIRQQAARGFPKTGKAVRSLRA